MGHYKEVAKAADAVTEEDVAIYILIISVLSVCNISWSYNSSPRLTPKSNFAEL